MDAIARTVAYATEHAPALAHAVLTASAAPTPEQVLDELQHAVEGLDAASADELGGHKAAARVFFSELQRIMEDFRRKYPEVAASAPLPTETEKEAQIAQIKAAAGL